MAFAQLANQVAATIDSRIQARNAAQVGDPTSTDPTVVVLLASSHRLRAHPSVARILQLGPLVGVTTICLADAAPQLPEECRAVAAFPVGERGAFRSASEMEFRDPRGRCRPGYHRLGRRGRPGACASPGRQAARNSIGPPCQGGPARPLGARAANS